MRLVDLDATFLRSTLDNFQKVIVGPDEPANGVLFDCPGCTAALKGQPGAHRVLIWFRNPIGNIPVAPPKFNPAPRWDRTGDTLDTLTLTPSIDCGCWHGFVTNGTTKTV